MDFPKVYGESMWEYVVSHRARTVMIRRENRYGGRIVYDNGVYGV